MGEDGRVRLPVQRREPKRVTESTRWTWGKPFVLLIWYLVVDQTRQRLIYCFFH